MTRISSQPELQRQYYAETATRYEAVHLHDRDEHTFALNFLVAGLDFYGIKSVLDVGSGTGRAIRYLKLHRPEIVANGIEPVAELRQIAYSHGISQEDLVYGDATNLGYQDKQFDLVCRLWSSSSY